MSPIADPRVVLLSMDLSTETNSDSLLVEQASRLLRRASGLMPLLSHVQISPQSEYYPFNSHRAANEIPFYYLRCNEKHSFRDFRRQRGVLVRLREIDP
jgi:hypothetical protein